jgi:beta-N-acetylhexosaminidase
MGLVFKERASAELALSALQRLNVVAPAGLSRMRRQGFPGAEYRQSPRW